MNFAKIPLAENPWGFWLVWVGTMLLMGIALLLSWRQRWL